MKRMIQFLIIAMVCSLILMKVSSLLVEKQKESNRVAKKIEEENVCIGLNYHRVKPPNVWNKTIELITSTEELTTFNVYRDDFEEQLSSLVAEGAYFATLEELIQFRKIGKFPEKCVWISFDDVEESVYQQAFPILKEKKIPFTLFVIAGQVGNQDFSNLKLATWDQLREMKDSGLASFGSHTYDMHYLEDNKATFLSESKHEEFAKDIAKSKDIMEKELGIPITAIAYPFGEASDEVVKIVKDSGFTDGFILSPNPIVPQNASYYQNRYVVDKYNFKSVILPWVKGKS